MIHNKISYEIATNHKWRMSGGNGHVENLGLDLKYWVKRICRLCLVCTLHSLCNPIIPKPLKT